MIKRIRKILGKCKYLLIIFISKINYAFFYKKNSYKILSDDEVIKKIINEKKSLSRFGDGEFKWMLGIDQNSFQVNDEKLKDKLLDVFNEENDNLIIGIPRALNTLNPFNREAKKEWKLFILLYYKRIKGLLKNKKNRVYADTNITRFYMDYKDKKECIHRIENLKQIWKNRDVIIIEGDKTRLGVGNDLFINAKSINRIIAPSKNAFEKYDEILKVSELLPHDKLILISLGPTASILSSDLSKRGYQAIDIGHIDIEYEWFLLNANKKIPIKGKYVNEAIEKGDLSNINIDDENYEKSIIKIIKAEGE